jgi:hypothetical protein
MGPSGARIGNSNIGSIPTNWHVAGVGDYKGDGTADIIWRDDLL